MKTKIQRRKLSHGGLTAPEKQNQAATAVGSGDWLGHGVERIKLWIISLWFPEPLLQVGDKLDNGATIVRIVEPNWGYKFRAFFIYIPFHYLCRLLDFIGEGLERNGFSRLGKFFQNRATDVAVFLFWIISHNWFVRGRVA
jgi:hypothetical protein